MQRFAQILCLFFGNAPDGELRVLKTGRMYWGRTMVLLKPDGENRRTFCFTAAAEERTAMP